MRPVYSYTRSPLACHLSHGFIRAFTFQVMMRSREVLSKEYVIFEEKFPNRSDPLVAPKFILDISLYHMLVFAHRYASRTTQYRDPRMCSTISKHLDFNHSDVGFLTWHRFFMLFWERQFAKMAKEQLRDAFTIIGNRNFHAISV